tara:strand:- start:1290 stop:1442 length:153 start_codon:yes stop_codon:yes gene_type:complete
MVTTTFAEEALQKQLKASPPIIYFARQQFWHQPNIWATSRTVKKIGIVGN